MKLFKHRTVRILLLTAQSLTLYRGEKERLFEERTFTADERGMAEFERYFDAASDTSVHLVVDLTEEDFRVEQIAHVRGRDRKALFDRKLLQFFRNTQYRSARLQGRETVGRRDDRVLFSALTNPEFLAPWIDVLIRRQVGIQSIISIPLLMESFAGWFQLDQLPHLLLVNLEERSILRQTYLQDGRLKFSRLLPLVGSDDPAEMVSAECRHTRQYLERLKLLPHDQPLEIHVCMREGTAEKFGMETASSPLLQFHFHETGMQAAELGIDPALLRGRGAVFLSLLKAWREGKLSNVYAPPPVTRYHRLRRIRRGLIAGASLLTAGALFSGGTLLYEGFTLIEEKQQIARVALELRNRHEELRRNFPETPVSAADMRMVVESAERIRTREISPARMMALASRAVALFPEIRIVRFDWRLTALTDAADGAEPVAAGMETPGRTEQLDSAPVLVSALREDRAAVIAILAGVVSAGSGYGTAQQSVAGLIAALEAVPGLRATPLSMPTDTKPSATLQAELDDHGPPAEFSMQLEYRGE